MKGRLSWPIRASTGPGMHQPLGQGLDWLPECLPGPILASWFQQNSRSSAHKGLYPSSLFPPSMEARVSPVAECMPGRGREQQAWRPPGDNLAVVRAQSQAESL